MSKTRINNVDIKKPLVGEDITLGSGISIYNSNSGTNNLGTAGLPFNSLYANNVFVSGGSIGNGIFVHLTGDTMSGSLTIGSGTSLLTGGSGVSNIATPGAPFLNAYVKNIVADTIIANTIISTGNEGAFVNITGDTMTGPLAISSGNLSMTNGSIVITSGNVSITKGNISLSNGTITSSGNISTTAGNILVAHPFSLFTTQILPATSAGISLSDTNGLGGIINMTSVGNGVGDAGKINLTLGVGVSGAGGQVNISAAGAGTTVQVSGNALILSNAVNLLTAASGGSNVGSPSKPFGNIYAQALVGPSGAFLSIAGGQMDGDLNFAPGVNVTFDQSGTSTIGTVALPLGTLYVDNIVSTGSAGDFVNITGDTMTGDLILTSPAKVVTSNISGSTLGIQSAGVMDFTAGGNIDFNTTNGYIDTYASGSYAIGAGYPNFGNKLLSLDTYGTLSSITLTTIGTLSDITISSTKNTTLVATSGVVVNSTVMRPNASGVTNLGTAALPFDTIYAKNFVASSPSGTFVHISGDTMTGDLKINSARLNQGLSNTLGTSAAQASVFGWSNTVNGTGASAFGFGNLAAGDYSQAKGVSTVASGIASSAEGNGTTAFGIYSHAEGNASFATGTSSHAEGESTISRGAGAHAEGYAGSAVGDYSHTEGYDNVASGLGAHAEGSGRNWALGEADHAQGSSTKAHSDMVFGAVAAHAEGFGTKAFGNASHAQGDGSIASGNTAFAAGLNALALHNYSTVFSDDNGASSTSVRQFTLGFASGVSLTSGTSVLNAVSEINSLGSISKPFKDIYAKTGYFTNISGMSPINIQSDVQPSVSGTINLGTAALPFGTLWASAISGVTLGSNFTGGAITSNLTPTSSGTLTIGTAALPFSGVHTGKINNVTVQYTAFNEQPAGTVNGVNTVFTLAHTPTNNSLQLFNQGVYQILSGTHATANNYSLSSSTITFGVAPTSGNTLMASTYGYLV